jgi:transposase
MRAYSLDLRSKIVEAIKRVVPKAEAARTFGVGISSVKRYVKMAEESLSLAPKKAPGKRKKLGEQGMRLLEEDLESRPAAKLKERVEFLFWVLAVRVSEATVCRMIRCLGYTRKKDRWVLVRGTSG